MIENCSTWACECMSDTTKSKIKDMKVYGEICIEEKSSFKIKGY